jgi:hypothetical protein
MSHVKGPVAVIESLHVDNQAAQGYPRWEMGHQWPAGTEVLVYTKELTSVTYHPDGEQAAIVYDAILQQRVESDESVVLTIPDQIDPETVSISAEGKLTRQIDSGGAAVIKGGKEQATETVSQPIAEAVSEVTLDKMVLPDGCEIGDLDETWVQATSPDEVKIEPSGESLGGLVGKPTGELGGKGIAENLTKL